MCDYAMHLSFNVNVEICIYVEMLNVNVDMLKVTWQSQYLLLVQCQSNGLEWLNIVPFNV